MAGRKRRELKNNSAGITIDTALLFRMQLIV